MNEDQYERMSLQKFINIESIQERKTDHRIAHLKYKDKALEIWVTEIFDAEHNLSYFFSEITVIQKSYRQVQSFTDDPTYYIRRDDGTIYEEIV